MHDNDIKYLLEIRASSIKDMRDSVELLLDNIDTVTSMVISFEFKDSQTDRPVCFTRWAGALNTAAGLVKRLDMTIDDAIYYETMGDEDDPGHEEEIYM